MDGETIKLVLGLFSIFFGFHSILFAWLFYRTNAITQKAEAIRVELDRKISEQDKKLEMARLELTSQIEGMRLEYVDKVAKLHEEDRHIRRDINEIQMSTYKALTELGDKIAAKIEHLDVMAKPDVLRLVDPIIDSNKKVADAVNVLIERTNK